VSFAPLQSAAVPRLPHASRCGAPPLGLPSLFATSASGVRHDGFPIPTALPFSAFLTPATVCSASGLVGLFHPTATSRVRPSGVSPLAQSRQLVAAACPLVGWRRSATGSCPPAPRSSAPPTGLCSMRESVADEPAVNRPAARSPLGLHPPPGFRSPRRADAFTPADAHDLRKGTVESFPLLVSSVPSWSPASLSRGCRPARGL